MSTSVTLFKCDIPLYLQEGDFFRNLDDGEDGSFTLSSHHFKADTSIANVSDLECLLSTLRFWGVNLCLVDVLKWAWLQPLACYEAILITYWEELAYLKDIYAVMSAPRAEALNVALGRNNMAIVEFLLGEGLKYNKESCIIAASTGNLEGLNKIEETEFMSIQDVLVAATKHGQLRILTEFIQRYPDVSQGYLCLKAAEYGQLDCLRILFPPNNINLRLKMDVCGHAAKNHHVACFKYACTPPLPQMRQCMDVAGFSGNLEILQHAFAVHNNTWERDDFRSIIRGGNVECLEFALNTNCPVDPRQAARAAVQRGKLSVIVWLMAHNISFQGTSDLAARSRNLEVVVYLHQHGVA